MDLTQKKYLAELANNKPEKVELEKIDLALFDDIQKTVTYANKTMETADKVVDAAGKVNRAISAVEDEAKYYNKYKNIAVQDLQGFEQLLEKQLKEAEQKAKELGVDLKLASPNYERGKLGLKDIKDVLRQLRNTNLEFDI